MTLGRSVVILALLSFVGVAGADEASPAQTIAAAQQALEHGEYERVVVMLRPLVESNVAVPGSFEALRLYGIACAMTDRRASAEGAFALMLEQPGLGLEHPKAAELFAHVHARLLTSETRGLRPRQLRRELVAGTVLAAFGLAGGVVSVSLDSFSLSEQLNQSSSLSHYNAQLAAIVVTSTLLLLAAAGIGLLIHSARSR